MVQLYEERSSSDSHDTHPELCCACVGMIGIGSELWRGCRCPPPRDIEKAYEHFIMTGKGSFDCFEMISSFKKKLLGGYIYVG